MDGYDFPQSVQWDLEEMTDLQKDIFWDSLGSGASPRFAAMCALQKAPSCQTADTASAQYGANNSQFSDDPEFGEMIVAKARQYDPNFSPVGKVYIGGTCPTGQQGHPSAWADGDVRAHIRKRCEEKGCDSQGIVDYKCTRRDELLEDKPYKVADSVVNKHVIAAVTADPSLKGKKDLVESVREKITPKDLK